MLEEAVIAFVSVVRLARLATSGPDGYPHVVPIWYELDLADPAHPNLWFISDRGAQKVKNAIVEPRAGAVIGGERDERIGYLFRGHVTIEDDVDHSRSHQMIDRYEHGQRNRELRDAWRNDDIVVMRLHIERVTTIQS